MDKNKSNNRIIVQLPSIYDQDPRFGEFGEGNMISMKFHQFTSINQQYILNYS